MKLYTSDRNIQLVSDFDIVEKFPCVTVERWNKWYSPFIVSKDGMVVNIEEMVYTYTDDPKKDYSIMSFEAQCDWENIAYTDHTWHPGDIVEWCAKHNFYIGEEAFKAIVMMWVEQHQKEPGFEINYIPTKELYDKVITPDNGYIVLCNSFTEKERMQFKFWKD